MASTIKLKNGSGAPLASDLVQGEPALDLTNKRLYTEDSLGAVIEVGTNPTSLTTGDITATGTTTITTADINGGAIDGTTIGGTTTAAGSFTTLQADTSLNVDGTVTADGLTVDGAGSFSTNLSIRTTSSPSGYNLHVSQDDSDKALAKFTNTTTGTTATDGFDVGLNATEEAIVWHQESKPIRFGTNSLDRLRIDADGDISFYEDTGTTAKFFWDASAESLGIGTTSPTYKVQAGKTSTGAGDQIAITSLEAAGSVATPYNMDLDFLGFDDRVRARIRAIDQSVNTEDSFLSFSVSNPLTEAMRIDSSGIDVTGTVTADGLTSQATANTYPGGAAIIQSLAGDNSYVTNVGGTFLISNSSVSDQFAITSDGNVGIGTTSPDAVLHLSNGSTSELRLGDALSFDNYFDEGSGIEFERTIGGQTMAIGVVDVDKLNIASRDGILFGVGGGATYSATSEAMRIDSSGNVGIGTSSPSALVEIAKDDRANGATLRITNSAASSSWTSGDIVGTIDFYSSDSSDADVRSRIQSVSTAGATNPGSVDLTFSTFSGSTLSEAMRIDSSGNLLFNSGFGSVATAFGCRAWVHFGGTSASIAASGNVSSVTDGGVGTYTVNFTSSMPDGNYSATCTTSSQPGVSSYHVERIQNLVTTQFTLDVADATNISNPRDPTDVLVTVIR